MKNFCTQVALVFLLLFCTADIYAQSLKYHPKTYLSNKDPHSIEALMERKEKRSPQMDDLKKTIFILNDDKVIDWKSFQTLNPKMVLSVKLLFSYTDMGKIDRRIVLIKTRTTTTAKEAGQ